MTFTPNPPTTPGFYAWIPDENNRHLLQLREVVKGIRQLVIKEPSRYFKDSAIGGLWCKLLPAEEVEKAFREGARMMFPPLATELQPIQKAWLLSNARKIVEGNV